MLAGRALHRHLLPILTCIVDTFGFVMGKNSRWPRLGNLGLVCSERPRALALQKFRGASYPITQGGHYTAVSFTWLDCLVDN